jgi:hypothetical protein
MRPAGRRSGWGVSGLLLGPSALLLPILGLYESFDGLGHFFLHTLTGWDVALVLLLTATYYGRPWSRWDGLLPLSLALYALVPDFIYIGGPHHRDWMDIFLFHVALDEILPLAVGTLALLWVGLMRGYLRFRARLQ